MVTERNPLTLKQIRAIFRRHHGAGTHLARELGVAPQNIYDCLKGIGRSQRVERAVRSRAHELLAQERESKGK